MQRSALGRGADAGSGGPRGPAWLRSCSRDASPLRGLPWLPPRLASTEYGVSCARPTSMGQVGSRPGAPCCCFYLGSGRFLGPFPTLVRGPGRG